MSLLRREHLGLGLAGEFAAGASMRTAGGSVSAETISIAPSSPDSDRLGATLDSLTRDIRNGARSCRVVLSSPWSREWPMTAPDGLRSLRELEDLATARFTQLYGETPDSWRIVGDWRARGTMLCGAIPHQLLAALSERLRALGMAASFTTFASSCLAALPVCRTQQWTCLRTPQSLIVALTEKHTLRALRHKPLDRAEQNAAWLPQLLEETERLALRTGLDRPTRVRYCDFMAGPAPAQRVEGVEIDPVASPVLSQARLDSDAALAAWLGAHL